MPAFKPVQAGETRQNSPADWTSGTAQGPEAPDSGHDYLGSRYASLGYRGARTDPGSRPGVESAAPLSRARQPRDTDPGQGIFPRIRPVDDSGSSRWFTPQTSEPRSDPAQPGLAQSDSVTPVPARLDPSQPDPAQPGPAEPGGAEPLPRRRKPADVTVPGTESVANPPSATSLPGGRAAPVTGMTAAEQTAAAPEPGSAPDGYAAPGAS
jgi:hypothetical protein